MTNDDSQSKINLHEWKRHTHAHTGEKERQTDRGFLNRHIHLSANRREFNALLALTACSLWTPMVSTPAA
jgi:hypothetical protein